MILLIWMICFKWRYSHDMKCCVNGLHAPNDGNKSSFSTFIMHEESSLKLGSLIDSSAQTIITDHSICTTLLPRLWPESLLVYLPNSTQISLTSTTRSAWFILTVWDESPCHHDPVPNSMQIGHLHSKTLSSQQLQGHEKQPITKSAARLKHLDNDVAHLDCATTSCRP